MRDYRARKRAAGLKRVATWVPATEIAGELYSDHRLLDARSLAMHALIARKITRDPALLAIPARNLERWQARGGERKLVYLNEWRRILGQPAAQVAAFITSLAPEATRLRQSSPFAGVLTSEERRRIYDAFRT